jgi:hypothetical protein
MEEQKTNESTKFQREEGGGEEGRRDVRGGTRDILANFSRS